MDGRASWGFKMKWNIILPKKQTEATIIQGRLASLGLIAYGVFLIMFTTDITSKLLGVCLVVSGFVSDEGFISAARMNGWYCGRT